MIAFSNPAHTDFQDLSLSSQVANPNWPRRPRVFLVFPSTAFLPLLQPFSPHPRPFEVFDRPPLPPPCWATLRQISAIYLNSTCTHGFLMMRLSADSLRRFKTFVYQRKCTQSKSMVFFPFKTIIACILRCMMRIVIIIRVLNLNPSTS